MKAKLIKTQKGYHLDTGKFDGIHLACYPHDVTKQRLSLKNCQAIERGYDLDELANNLYLTSGGISDKLSFKIGFQKALELMGDKKFTEKDVILAVVLACDDDYKGNIIEAIEIKQTEWNVEIVMEPCYYDNSLGGFSTSYKPGMPTEKPKLDADGCLILKRV